MKREKKNFSWMIIAMLLITGCGKVQNPTTDNQNKIEVTANETTTSESLYLVTDKFTTQNNKTVQLSNFKGKPTVVSMIFTSCGYACPRLTADIQQIEKKLGTKANDVNFVLVTFDLERDTPEVLKEYATTHGLGKNWTLLHGDDSGVQTLSILLNIPFEKDEDGNFSHGNTVTVLDENGSIQYQKEGLGNTPEPAVKVIQNLLKK